MAWNESVITAAGVRMLNETLAGRSLLITSAYGGTGTADEQSLKSLADLTDRTQTLSLVGLTDVENGKMVTIRISNSGVDEGYWLRQIGVFAHLGGDEEDALLFVMQDKRGIYIPAASKTPEFILEIYGIIAISNEANIAITLESHSSVSAYQVGEMIKDAVSKHNTDEESHGIMEAIAEVKAYTDQKSNSAIIRAVTIPASGWQNATENGKYSYYIDISIPEVKEAYYPIGTLYDDSLEIAESAGLSPKVEAVTGALRFWAESIPTASMVGSFVILANGGGYTPGGEKYDLPAATETVLGGVKIGDRIKVDSDGTISSEDELTPEEYDELNEILEGRTENE